MKRFTGSSWHKNKTSLVIMIVRLSLCGVLVLFCGLSASCNTTRFATTAERLASVAPYAGTKVGQQPLHDFLLERSAAVIEDEKTDNASVGVGSAAAIDRRGYLLTAAHVLRGNNSTPLVFSMGAIRRLGQVRAQVVWRSDVSKNQPDVAILYIGIPLTEVFEWAPEPKDGDIVFAVGPYFDESHKGGLAISNYSYVAGRLLNASHHSVQMPPINWFDHNAPLHGGDSGGRSQQWTAASLASIRRSFCLY